MFIRSSRRYQADQSQALPLASAETADGAEPPATSEPEDKGVLSGDAGQRVGHFVRGVTLESLQHLRYLAAANAGQKIGSAIGSVGLTPLAISLANDNAPLVGGLAIGGTIAAGAVGALIGYGLLYKKDGAEKKLHEFSRINDTALTLGTALQALPKFVYPTVSNATAAQTETVYSALDSLPLHQATASATVDIVPNLLDTGISGMAQPGASHVHMLLDESRINGYSGSHLVLHEQAHAVDYSGGFGLLGAHNWKAGFGKAPFVSNYAKSNRYEDFAESFEAYNVDPEGFKANFPDKAAAIEELSYTDPISAAADTPRVREAGKKLGIAMGKVPHLRTGLELASSLVSPALVYRGASKLTQALETGDDNMKLDGKLNLATGLFLGLPGARGLAFGTSVAGAAIKATADESKQAHMESANLWADRVLATSAGPVGMTVAAMTGELKKHGMRVDETQGFGPQGWQAARPGSGTMLKGTLATVGGTVAGALVGAAVGGAVSGNGGAVLGALWGQAAGGITGLAAYSVSRTLSQDNDDPLALTKSDRKFLGRTAAGAVAGGAAGTLGGVVAGRFLGHTAGQAFGDAGLASVLGSVGSWVGGLAGAYGGAKLGAGVGSGRLLGKEIYGEPPQPEEQAKDPNKEWQSAMGWE